MKFNEQEDFLLRSVKLALRGERIDSGVLPESFPELAMHHKLLPLVCEGLDPVPAVLKKQAMIQVASQTRRSIGALTAYEHLRSLGAHPLIVKGALCRMLYPSPDHRISGDEDFYVREDEFDLCCRGLEQLGMKPSDPKLESWYDSGKTVHIELHRKLFGDFQLREYPLEELFGDGFERTQLYTLDQGTEIESLDPHMHFLYLILHAYKHFLFSGFGVRQLCDIGLWARAYERSIDWKLLYRQCEKVRAVYFTAAVFRIVRETLEISFGLPMMWKAVSVDPEPLLLDILDAGIYGSASSERLHSAVALGQGNRNPLRTIFPERSYMLAKYPPQPGQKTPPLPVLWGKRLGEYAINVLKKQEDPMGAAALVKQRRKLLRYYKIQ